MVSTRMTCYFKFLSILATILLWGVSLANGTVKALLMAVWSGTLSNGIPLRKSYLGFPPVDLLIALLVAFFFYGTKSHDEGYQLFLVDAYCSLQPAFVWLYVEAARPGTKPYWISRPIVFGLMWQCFGGAISLPLYYAMHLQWTRFGTLDRVRNSSEASAIPLSYCLGALLPAISALGTTWLGSESRTDGTHQLILGLFQPDPVWVSALQAVVPMVIAALRPGLRKSPDRNKRDNLADSYFWVRSSYLFAAATSGLGHLYVICRVVTSADRDVVGLVRMYVPFLFSGPFGISEDIFVYGPWLFLQYDLIIISLSSLSWAYFLLTAAQPAKATGLSARVLFVYLLVGSFSIGPGATVSMALWYREGILAEGGCDE